MFAARDIVVELAQGITAHISVSSVSKGSLRYNSYQAGYRFGCRKPRIPILPRGDPNADSLVQMQADTNGIVHAARYTSSGLGSSARAAGEACVVRPPASLWPPGRASLMRRASTMSAPSRVSSERYRHLGTCARSRVRVGPRVGALWARVVRAGRTYCCPGAGRPRACRCPSSSLDGLRGGAHVVCRVRCCS